MSEEGDISARSTSLRDSYSPPPTDWSFVASTSAAGSALESAGSSWRTRSPPSKSPVLELSPYPFENDSNYGHDIRGLLKPLISAGLLQYATTGIAMPFEVAKVLMQVQWIPKDAIEGEDLHVILNASDDGKEEESLSEASSESYFHDPAREAFSSLRSDGERPVKSLLTDGDGYIMRQSINDEETKLDYVLPVISTDGVWGMIKRIREFQPEGWTALWKSQLTSTLSETLTPIVQSGLQAFIMSAFAPAYSMQLYPLPASRLPTSHLIISLTSHILTGIFLSPLDLVRTRLIVQSSHPDHMTYSGPLSALRQITAEVGGLRALYTHPSLLVPAILDNTINPLVLLLTPIFLHRTLGIEEDTHPISYALASCTCSSAALLVTLPIETVRRRMQVQVLGSPRGMQACVELSPRPYIGVLDTAWRIVTEERSSPRRRKRIRRASTAGRRESFKGKEREGTPRTTIMVEDGELEDDGWFASTGIAQLYRGFSMSLTASAVVFALSAVAVLSGEESNSGWTEL